jgi:prolyl oligopeptidase
MTAYVYDAKAKTSQPFNPPKLTFDPTRFLTERVFYQSKEGTRVRNGQNPTMFYGYGGFSDSETPSSDSEAVAFIVTLFC